MIDLPGASKYYRVTEGMRLCAARTWHATRV